jgi:hypothetical protein
MANHEHSRDQMSADACCARHEQSHQGLSSHPFSWWIAQAHAAAILVPAFAAPVVDQAATARCSSALIDHLHARSDPPLPPLRI